MDLRTANIESDGSPEPRTIFVLPELQPPRSTDLTLLILADGNRRAAPGKGYAGGARNVVAIAEHLAQKPDVSALVACILSPDNVARRGDPFFAELRKEFLRLGAEIESRGALISRRIRMEPWGDLASLRARGGEAIALADAIEAVSAMTGQVTRPELRLLLGIGYGPDSARELGADILLRTGMEEPGALRLSGLRAGEAVTCFATTTLWPDLEPREVDGMIDLHKQRGGRRFAAGYTASQIVALTEALGAADLGAPVQVIIATPSEPPPDVGELWAVLAPGQEPPLFTLPDWLPLGHANVHACPATALGIVEGIRAALRFSAAHPPLFGGDRQIVPSAVEARSAADERDAIADRFVADHLEWGERAGLLLPDPSFRNAAANYLLTAFYIHFRIPTEWDETAERWQERAVLTAQYMLLVAVGDEGIFDRVFEGEAREQRFARLEASSRFLRDSLRADARLPRVQGADLLVTIAAQWRAIFARYHDTCHPGVAAYFRAGLNNLYAASLAEHRPRRAPALLVRAPPCIAQRARALGRGGDRAAEDELRALLHLAETNSAIAAGLLFRTAALAAPAASVTAEAVTALDTAATLFDYHFRLANDLSSLLDAPSGDRDPKDNACTLLVPPSASGPARAAAFVRALSTGRRLSAWLAGEVAGQIGHLATTWPSMAEIFRRGGFVGRRVYEVGHYTTVSRAQMSAIFAEADQTLTATAPPRRSPGSSG